MIFGYARCSTDEQKQDIHRQTRELRDMGVPTENTYLEYESGTSRNRTELNRLLEAVQPGDTIMSTEVSRITRSTKQLCEIVDFAKDKQLKLVFGAFVVDCTNELDPMTEGMLKMMGVFSELERNIISQRVKSGLANAREKGKRIGRPTTALKDLPAPFLRFYPKYRAGDFNKSDLARLCQLSYPTVIKYVNLVENICCEHNKRSAQCATI